MVASGGGRQEEEEKPQQQSETQQTVRVHQNKEVDATKDEQALSTKGLIKAKGKSAGKAIKMYLLPSPVHPAEEKAKEAHAAEMAHTVDIIDGGNRKRKQKSGCGLLRVFKCLLPYLIGGFAAGIALHLLISTLQGHYYHNSAAVAQARQTSMEIMDLHRQNNELRNTMAQRLVEEQNRLQELKVRSQQKAKEEIETPAVVKEEMGGTSKDELQSERSIMPMIMSMLNGLRGPLSSPLLNKDDESSPLLGGFRIMMKFPNEEEQKPTIDNELKTMEEAVEDDMRQIIDGMLQSGPPLQSFAAINEQPPPPPMMQMLQRFPGGMAGVRMVNRPEPLIDVPQPDGRTQLIERITSMLQDLPGKVSSVKITTSADQAVNPFDRILGRTRGVMMSEHEGRPERTFFRTHRNPDPLAELLQQPSLRQINNFGPVFDQQEPVGLDMHPLALMMLSNQNNNRDFPSPAAEFRMPEQNRLPQHEQQARLPMPGRFPIMSIHEHINLIEPEDVYEEEEFDRQPQNPFRPENFPEDNRQEYPHEEHNFGRVIRFESGPPPPEMLAVDSRPQSFARVQQPPPPFFHQVPLGRGFHRQPFNEAFDHPEHQEQVPEQRLTPEARGYSWPQPTIIQRHVQHPEVAPPMMRMPEELEARQEQPESRRILFVPHSPQNMPRPEHQRPQEEVPAIMKMFGDQIASGRPQMEQWQQPQPHEVFGHPQGQRVPEYDDEQPEEEYRDIEEEVAEPSVIKQNAMAPPIFLPFFKNLIPRILLNTKQQPDQQEKRPFGAIPELSLLPPLMFPDADPAQHEGQDSGIWENENHVPDDLNRPGDEAVIYDYLPTVEKTEGAYFPPVITEEIAEPVPEHSHEPYQDIVQYSNEELTPEPVPESQPEPASEFSPETGAEDGQEEIVMPVEVKQLEVKEEQPPMIVSPDVEVFDPAAVLTSHPSMTIDQNEQQPIKIVSAVPVDVGEGAQELLKQQQDGAKEDAVDAAVTSNMKNVEEELEAVE